MDGRGAGETLPVILLSELLRGAGWSTILGGDSHRFKGILRHDDNCNGGVQTDRGQYNHHNSTNPSVLGSVMH